MTRSIGAISVYQKLKCSVMLYDCLNFAILVFLRHLGILRHLGKIN